MQNGRLESGPGCSGITKTSAFGHGRHLPPVLPQILPAQLTLLWCSVPELAYPPDSLWHERAWLLQDGQLEGPPILDEFDVTTQLGKDFQPTKK